MKYWSKCTDYIAEEDEERGQRSVMVGGGAHAAERVSKRKREEEEDRGGRYATGRTGGHEEATARCVWCVRQHGKVSGWEELIFTRPFFSRYATLASLWWGGEGRGRGAVREEGAGFVVVCVSATTAHTAWGESTERQSVTHTHSEYTLYCNVDLCYTSTHTSSDFTVASRLLEFQNKRQSKLRKEGRKKNARAIISFYCRQVQIQK